MKTLFFLLTFFSTLALAETLEPPKIIKETNGKFTNLRAEGSLESTRTIGCIPLAQAKNTFTPPDLYKGLGECLSQDNYEFSAGLSALAGIYAMFDAARITDKTAGQAKSGLIMNTFSTVPLEKKQKYVEAINRVAKNPEQLGKLCGEIKEIGMPNYYPSYMILHGIKAFTGNPHEGALIKDFDSSSVWKKLQSDFLHCPS